MNSKALKVTKNHTLALRDRANTPAPSLIRGPKSAAAGSAQNGRTLSKFDLSRQFKQKDQ